MITRRSALFALAGVPLLANQAVAAITCAPYLTPYRQLTGVNRCQVGVALGPIETARQTQPHWCWAASISALFTMHGHPVSQERIHDKVFPRSGSDDAGDGPHIIEAINGDWIDDHGGTFTAEGSVLLDAAYALRNPAAGALAATELDMGNPLIVGSEGHACVLTAMTYNVDQLTRGQILALTVRDPYPGSPNLRYYRGDEAINMSFMCSVHVDDS